MKLFLVKICICLFLVAATICVYWQIRNHGPINADDFYITSHKYIGNAVTFRNFIEWAGILVNGVWMPLTYLSIATEMELFGTDFGAYHLVSAVLHAANAVILFLLLFRMTRAIWKSALVAALFAVHPLNVEPVSWLVAIRVIQCGFFCLLTIYFYVLYVDRRSSVYYTLCLFCYTAGLLSVPMFPAMPCLLLLLDFWPLDRLGAKKNDTSWQNFSLPKIGRAVWEKFPFFGIMAALIAALLLLHDLSSSPGIDRYPFNERLFNVLFSYVRYIQQVLTPVNLAVFYPFPESFPVWKISGAVLVLATITAVPLIFIRRYPFLIVGWLWFAGMLFPLSGVAQIGTQARADHYTYLPAIGLFILICWGATALARRLRIPPVAITLASILVIGLLTCLSWRQAGYWKNSVTIMTHALKVTRNNYEAHNYLAQAFASQGDLRSAVDHFQKALAIKPDHLKSHINLGNVYSSIGQTDSAIRHFTRAAEKDPNNEKVHNNLGALYEKANDTRTALFHYRRAVAINPAYAVAYENLAVLEANTGDISGAIIHFKQALLINSRSAETRFRLGVLLYQAGRTEEAVDQLRRALDIDPENSQYREFLTTISHDRSAREKPPGS